MPRHSRLTTTITALFTAVVLSACQHTGGGTAPTAHPVSAVFMQERQNANGFFLNTVYQSDSPLILAHVEESQVLFDASGNLLKTLRLDYWEWFSLGNLPNQGNIPAAEWGRISGFQGKTVVLSDIIQSLPGAVAEGVTLPDGFRIIISRRHTYFTGATLDGQQGQGTGLDLGRFGFLDRDQDGNGPSLSARAGSQFSDITAAWRQNKDVRGSITDKGTEQLKIEVVHDSHWQRDNANPPFAVEWTYWHRIGSTARVDRNGTATGVSITGRP